MMNTKYFYYISKTKVDMLLSQFRHSKLAVPKITPKIDVVGIGIETAKLACAWHQAFESSPK
jgi:hypothetical protein